MEPIEIPPYRVKDIKDKNHKVMLNKIINYYVGILRWPEGMDRKEAKRALIMLLDEGMVRFYRDETSLDVYMEIYDNHIKEYREISKKKTYTLEEIIYGE